MLEIFYPEKVAFDPAVCSVLLTVRREDVADVIAKYADFSSTRQLEVKKEFHITAVGYGTGALLLKAGQEHNLPTAERMGELVNRCEWEYSIASQDAYLVEREYKDKETKEVRERRTSIIQLVFLPEISRLYVDLEKMFGVELPTPVPHVTLYTTSTVRENISAGIGIESKKAFAQLQKTKLS